METNESEQDFNLDRFKSTVNFEIDTFKKYIIENEKILCNVETELSDKFLNSSGINESLKASYFIYHYNLEEKLLHKFKNIQRFSIFTFILSFFESKLNLLNAHSTNVSGEASNELNSYIILLQKIKLLRNKVSNNESVLTTEEITTISKIQGLTINNDQLSFTIHSEFLYAFLEKVNHHLSHITNQ